MSGSQSPRKKLLRLQRSSAASIQDDSDWYQSNRFEVESESEPEQESHTTSNGSYDGKGVSISGPEVPDDSPLSWREVQKVEDDEYLKNHGQTLMLIHSCPECEDTPIRARDWINGSKPCIQYDDGTTRYESYEQFTWFCPLKGCGKRFNIKKGWKKRVMLFQNGKKDERNPGYSVYNIGEVNAEQENVLQMLKAITSVVMIENTLAYRNEDFDLTKFDVHSFGDLVDILGNDSLRQARRIVDKEGILYKQAIDLKEALKAAHEVYGEDLQLLWDDDRSGYRGQLENIPVLKDKSEDTLQDGDIQIITELMISALGIEGYRNDLLRTSTQKAIMREVNKDSESTPKWENFSKGQSKSGRLFKKILWRMEDDNLRELVERVRERKKRLGEMCVEESY